MSVRIGVRSDGSARMGVGHLIRCLALTDELVARGVEVVMLSDIPDVPWLRDQVDRRGLPMVHPEDDPAALARQAADLALDAVVLDGYHLDPGTGRALRQQGTPVLAILDAEFGAAQEADVYLDQNLGAQDLRSRPPDSVMLPGLDYTLFRDQVVDRRGEQPDPALSPVRVLTVFGGTDPFGAAPVVVPLLLETGLPLHVVAVAARPEVASELEDLPRARHQLLEVRGPVEDLAGLAVTCHAAVSAAGSSVWELLCIGVPSALVAVADNQEVGYRSVIEHDVVAPVGRLGELREDDAAREEAVATLRRLVTDAAYRKRLREHGMALVDGQGRARVADALLGLVARSA